MSPETTGRWTGCWKSQCADHFRKPCWMMGKQGLGPGLDVYGFFLSEIGLGHTARLYHMAALSAGIESCAINRPLPGRQNDLRYQGLVTENGQNRMSVTIDGLIGFGRIRRQICRQRFNIAFPLWELEHIPERRRKHLQKFDAYWAPSNFIKNSLNAALGQKVALVPHPIEFPVLEDNQREGDTPLRLLFFFDFDSFSARKNPEGAVRAFQAAFPGKEDVQLTIKTRGGQDRGRRAWLQEQAERDLRISIIDQTLPYDAITALIRSHDVFLSLHRSEGFGLGCAEALALEKIVVATDYGGTTDFISPQTGFPVSWTRSPVGADNYVDGVDASWAEPSIEDTVTQLRQIYDDPNAAKTRAQNGRQTLMKRHSLEVVGQQIKSILQSYS